MSSTYTITEALAELKTIDKRLEKKRAYVMPYLWRQEGLKDPLEKQGGSEETIKRERQAIHDLEERIVNIRTAIQSKNLSTLLTIQDRTRTVMGWLNWRKEVAKGQVAFVNQLRADLITVRKNAQTKGMQVFGPGAVTEKPMDILVNVDEAALAAEAEMLETILGDLDGKLSLLNATTSVTIPD